MDMKTAEELLVWAGKQNPGPWVDHSRVVARAAKAIALKCHLDDEKAYIFGLLHDIGRYEGIRDLHHIYAGYKLMIEKGYNDIARICLTHSFQYKNINAYSGKNDCMKEEINEIRMALNSYKYDDYDKLIQLCDSISMAKGVYLLDIRLFA